MIERTLVIFKPDAVMRGLVGELLHRFERSGLHILAGKFVQADRELAAVHYEEHQGKPFYDDLLEFITEGPVLATVLAGRGAISTCRKLRGPTDPAVAPPGTICGDYSHYLYRARNLIHASADEKSAAREIELWFTPDEIHLYNRYDAPATLGSIE
jgi:nucleoside-diphosphate kinase